MTTHFVSTVEHFVRTRHEMEKRPKVGDRFVFGAKVYMVIWTRKAIDDDVVALLAAGVKLPRTERLSPRTHQINGSIKPWVAS